MSDTSMIINYVPGEECRVAIVSDGNLEELHAERTDAVSRVNNIYVGRVTNVEAGIQAAFVDFGLEENGFLHVSDLHPRYFVDDDASERVGKKTPRRERPPIQQCLKRGQEVIVQVIKEGVGTKGPTLTSYLSIPGRYLVMMPQMDKVGVSRKVEDEEQRAKMKEILGQLELPEGFGFILRTAGFDRNKTDLKRDLAYLQRLWKNMEAMRTRSGKRVRLLYSESDLLVRALRDLVTPDISRIVIDDEGAVARAAQFMKIVSPRSTVKVMRYTGGRPIFHAFGIEQQIALTHAREVPLPSGGRLVIDETEAIVAIDVNSGKSRQARDAETNAYKTNAEAVEVICRQIRLRDLGGIVINDLIDMRSAKHRKAIEQLFRERLKRDRAKSTIAPISPFGILEMTRQRMRGSLRSQHFVECPACRGKGLVQRPKSVASDALREVAVLLEHDKVHRVELVVSGRVAGELLSSRRGSLNRIERRTEKQIQVRVSDTLAVDRFTIYAYDAAGADVDPDKLPKPKSPEQDLEPVETRGEDAWAVDPHEEGAQAGEEPAPPEPEAPVQHPIEVEFDQHDEVGEGGKKKRRRRRRRKKSGENAEGAADQASQEQPDEQPSEQPDDQDQPDQQPEAQAGDQPDEEGQPKKKRRRRRRRRKSGQQNADAAQTGADSPNEGHAEGQADGQTEDQAAAPARVSAAEASPGSASEAPRESLDGERGDDAPRGKKKRRRSRRKKSEATNGAAAPESADSPDVGSESGSEEAERATEAGEGSKKVKKKRRRSGSEARGEEVEPKPAATESPDGPQPTKKTKRPRTLYGAVRRRLGPSEVATRLSEDQ